MKPKIILTLLATIFAISSWAQEVDGIYYQIFGNGTATVMPAEYNYRNNQNLYTGYVMIPDEVVYNGEKYTVTRIGQNAFDSSTSLTAVRLPAGLTGILSNAFRNCPNLKTLYVGTKTVTASLIENIGVGSRYPALEEIVIEESVDTIYDHAFSPYGNTLKRVTINSNAVVSAEYSYGGSLVSRFGFPKNNNNFYVSGTPVEQFILGEGIETIGNRAFCGSTGRGDSFDGEYNASVCFTSITLPKTLKRIGNMAFWHCNHLQTLSIPASVESIGENVFDGCCALTHIEVEDGNTHYDSRSGCNAIIETATNTLLRGCQNTTIPTSVTAIGNYAFDWCQGLSTIILPEHITLIGEGAFYGCLDLKDIYCSHSDPSAYNCQAGTYGLYRMFELVPKENVTLHVPAGCGDAYRALEPWSDFGTIVEDFEPTAINLVRSDGTKPDAYYNLQGQRIANPQRGQIVIIRYSDGTSRKVLMK